MMCDGYAYPHVMPQYVRYGNISNNNNNNNEYFLVRFIRRAHRPFIHRKKQRQRCEHRIRKNQQIKSTVHVAS